MLLATLILHHLPDLITQGKVYAAVPPLFKTVTARETKYWVPSEIKEYNKYIKTHKVTETTRFKGLGEMSNKELYETTMNPANRKLVRLTTDNLENTLKLYEDLMGKSPAARRAFIMSNNLNSYDEDDIFDDIDEDGDF